jgi:hypothetical protein
VFNVKEGSGLVKERETGFSRITCNYSPACEDSESWRRRSLISRRYKSNCER